MKFGIHSMLFNETFTEKDLPVLDKARKIGFDAVESIPFDLDNFPAAKVRKAAADLGLTINTGFGMPVECNTISPDAAVRREGRKRPDGHGAQPPGGVGQNRRQGFGQGELQPPGDQHRRRLGGLADTKITKVPEVVGDAGQPPCARCFQADPVTQIVQPGFDAKVMQRNFRKRPRQDARTPLRTAVTVHPGILVDLDFNFDLTVQK